MSHTDYNAALVFLVLSLSHDLKMAMFASLLYQYLEKGRFIDVMVLRSDAVVIVVNRQFLH